MLSVCRCDSDSPPGLGGLFDRSPGEPRPNSDETGSGKTPRREDGEKGPLGTFEGDLSLRKGGNPLNRRSVGSFTLGGPSFLV